jgi:hypothetical protein
MYTDAIYFFSKICVYKYFSLNVFIGDNMSDQNVNVAANQPQTNPLANWYRQPKIYVKLPSGGKFYPQGALDVSSNEQYPVYAMTAKDELMFKTPDALLSGQSTVEVIKSCVPAILDPWQLPSIDLDFLLIAIRIATYGENMEIGTTCPACSAANEYEVNLTQWLGLFNDFTYTENISIDPLVVYVRPYTYKEMTKTSIKTIEQQRIFGIINDENTSDEEKIDKFGKSFVKLTELTIDIIADCITKIDTPNGSTSDKAQIKEFINNTSKEVFDTLSNHLTAIKDQIELKAQHVQCGECNHEYEVPITMDQANFFAVKS